MSHQEKPEWSRNKKARTINYSATSLMIGTFAYAYADGLSFEHAAAVTLGTALFMGGVSVVSQIGVDTICGAAEINDYDVDDRRKTVALSACLAMTISSIFLAPELTNAMQDVIQENAEKKNAKDNTVTAKWFDNANITNQITILDNKTAHFNNCIKPKA